MRAVAWHGKRDVRVEEVPDPGVREPDDENFQKKEDGSFKVVLQP